MTMKKLLPGVVIALLPLSSALAASSDPAVPGWITVLPPIIAIAFAILTKRVIPALFVGIWFGAWAASGLGLVDVWSGLLDSFQVYVLGAVANEDHAAVMLFSFMIGGMVGIVSRNGGMQGIVNHIVRWARTSRHGQTATGLLGLVVFFDDYANTLIVGNAMRPVTDRLRISREKLAYIVDSTAAPVTAIAFVTTWIGYEVGLIGDAVDKIDTLNMSAYGIFLSSIAYSFYPILAVMFVFAVALLHRDFGPMYKAEMRARTTGEVLGPGAEVDDAATGLEMAPNPDKPQRAINAIAPVLTLIVSVLTGLYVTGEGDNLRDIIGTADSYKALMWASLLSVVVAVVLSLSQRVLNLEETIAAWYSGVKSMMYAMIVLVLAWSLGAITEVLGTADYLVLVLGDTLPPGLVPAIVFVLAAATAFATGTSWGTMGILVPLVVPLSWSVMQVNGMTDAGDFHILYSSVASVLAGAVWGDHCSPISDTTILSSMASGCDHIEHVRTQLPYAGLVGVVAVLLGTVPAGFGFPWWLSLIIGTGFLLLALRVIGKPVPTHE